MQEQYGLDINDPRETRRSAGCSPGMAINNSAFICLFYDYLINLLKDLSNLLLQDIPKHQFLTRYLHIFKIEQIVPRHIGPRYLPVL